MALYAFDGTWNEDDGNAGGDTNVVKFREAYLGENFDLIVNARCKYWPNDKKHPSAISVELQPGNSETFHVYAKEHYTWTGIRLIKDATYSFSVDNDQFWIDKEIKCSAPGLSNARVGLLRQVRRRHVS